MNQTIPTTVSIKMKQHFLRILLDSLAKQINGFESLILLVKE